MLLLLEPYLHSKLKCVFHLFMLRIMVKVNAYILSVHSSSGFYEELHQVVVTLPSRQVKRLKLGYWRFVRDYFRFKRSKPGRRMDLSQLWVVPGQGIVWTNIFKYKVIPNIWYLYNIFQYFRILSCSWARHCLNNYFEMCSNSKYLILWNV